MPSKANYAASFRELGYELRFNQEWAAECESGVCISLWKSELDKRGGELYDTKLHCDPLESWDASNNTKRKTMLKSAEEKHDGWIDVVIRDDSISRSCAPTVPWIISDQGNMRWKLKSLERDTGHFSAKIEEYK